RSDAAQARGLYEESLALYREMGSEAGIAGCLAGLAGMEVARGQPALAARMFGVIEALHDAFIAEMDQVFHADYDRHMAAARAQQGEAAFEAAWAEGQAMTLEQAIEEAQVLIPEPATPIRKPANLEISDNTGVYQIPNDLWERIAPELPPVHGKKTGRPR